MTFESFPDRAAELRALVAAVQRDLTEGGLQPSRHLLIVVPGLDGQPYGLQKAVFQALREAGVSVYLPGQPGRRRAEAALAGHGPQRVLARGLRHRQPGDAGQGQRGRRRVCGGARSCRGAGGQHQAAQPAVRGHQPQSGVGAPERGGHGRHEARG